MLQKWSHSGMSNVTSVCCPKRNVFHFIHEREQNIASTWNYESSELFISRKLPRVLAKKDINLGEVNKIFAAKWVDNQHVICGTKCNKLIAFNVDTSQTWNIPMLEGSRHRMAPAKSCGIHSISFNPSSTMMVTGGAYTNDVAVYLLPSLEPFCLGQFHKDWIFSTAWIDDHIFASGCRDGSLAMWDVSRAVLNDRSTNHAVITPVFTQQASPCVNRVRDLIFNKRNNRLTAISSNGYLHFWDPTHLALVSSTVLPHCKENVCLAQDGNGLLYAVGSMSHVSLHDSRDGRCVGSICTQQKGDGVRSLSFRECVLSIGSGVGTMCFYDLRMNRYLRRHDNTTCTLEAGRGWLFQNDVFRDYFWDVSSCSNAIYTHAYDPTMTRLFMAGGPQAIGLVGNYAALWE